MHGYSPLYNRNKSGCTQLQVILVGEVQEDFIMSTTQPENWNQSSFRCFEVPNPPIPLREREPHSPSASDKHWEDKLGSKASYSFARVTISCAHPSECVHSRLPPVSVVCSVWQPRSLWQLLGRDCLHHPLQEVVHARLLLHRGKPLVAITSSLLTVFHCLVMTKECLTPQSYSCSRTCDST